MSEMVSFYLKRLEKNVWSLAIVETAFFGTEKVATLIIEKLGDVWKIMLIEGVLGEVIFIGKG